MDYPTWLHRLTDTFTEHGVLAPHLVDVLAGEEEYEAGIGSIAHAHGVLVDCFQSFWVETMREALRLFGQRRPGTATTHFAETVLDHIVYFRRLRGAEVLLHSGYPLIAYSVVRDVVEQALLLAAVANRITTLAKIEGHEAWEASVIAETDGATLADSSREARARRARQIRKKEQRSALDQMLGVKSALAPDTVKQLAQWSNLFDLEVHGSHLTEQETSTTLSQGGRLSLAPVPTRLSVVAYMNRSEEAGWLWLRLLPLLQLTSGAFGPEWGAQWVVLDESFRFQVEGLAALKKPVADAVLALVDKMFPFGPGSSYVE